MFWKDFFGEREDVKHGRTAVACGGRSRKKSIVRRREKTFFEGRWISLGRVKLLAFFRR